MRPFKRLRTVIAFLVIFGISGGLAKTNAYNTIMQIMPETTQVTLRQWTLWLPDRQEIQAHTQSLLSPPDGVPETATPAQVVRVVDGDTIIVSIGGQEHRVRYIGIDTPETVKPGVPVQFMGPEASKKNKELVSGKTIYLLKDVSETDRYGRLLRYVFLSDGTFINAELVRLGYARVATFPPDVRFSAYFLQLEQQARAARRGLWQ